MNQKPYDYSIKGIFKEDAEELIPNFLEGARLTDVFDIEVQISYLADGIPGRQ